MDLILIIAGIAVIVIGLLRKDKNGKRTSQGKKIALAGAVLLIIGIIWFGVGFANGFMKGINAYKDSMPSTTSSETNTTTNEAYPQAVVDTFTNSCISESGIGEEARAYCTCVVEAVQEEYSLTEFANLEKQITESGETPEELTQAIQSCIQQ